MRPALLLVDLQADFLLRPGLSPTAAELTAQAAKLLDGCRALAVPILHAHTSVRQDGGDSMPHWKRNGIRMCVEKTPGVLAPPSVAPAPRERVFRKQYFSAFGAPGLHTALQALRIDTLIIAGVYLHGCVRSSVLDAYERGLEVWVAGDAVGSCDAEHAAITRRYLDGRAASFLDSAAILDRLAVPKAGSA